MQRTVTDYSLYRSRYILGYIVLIIGIAAMLLFAGLYAPGAIRAEEIDAITKSSLIAFLDFNPETIVNLPYHVLQRGSLELFGVSTLSIKLPSIILGILAIAGIYLLVREWFRNNIAVITTLLAATTPMFLFMAQDGTALIYVASISAWLLYAATMVSRRKNPTLVWKILLFILMALNLYTPLGIYLNIAIGTTVLFHPHVRHTLKRFNPNKIIGAAAVALIMLVPLIYSLSTQPTLGLQMLGIPASMPNFTENGMVVLMTLFNFRGGSANGVIQPMISLGLAIIMIVGIYRFFQVKYTARSYIIWLWGGILLPFILMQPDYVPYLFVLIVLMIAMGISSLIITWYSMFPKNPYARVAGLIPLSVIVVGISLSGANRYALSYAYSPEINRYYSQDAKLLSNLRKDLNEDIITLVIAESESPFYEVYARYDDTVTLQKTTPKGTSETLVVTSNAFKKDRPVRAISTIVTDGQNGDSDRFYVYKPSKE